MAVSVTVAAAATKEAAEDCSFTLSRKDVPKTRHRCPESDSLAIEALLGRASLETCAAPSSSHVRHPFTAGHNVLIVGDSLEKQLFHTILFTQGQFGSFPDSLLLNTPGGGGGGAAGSAAPTPRPLVAAEPELTPVVMRVPGGGKVIWCRDNLRTSFGGNSGYVRGRWHQDGVIPRNLSSVGQWGVSDCFPRLDGTLAALPGVPITHMFLGGVRHNAYVGNVGIKAFRRDLGNVLALYRCADRR